jgi:hypothetical protein
MLLAATVVSLALMIALGLTWHGEPGRYFKERKAGTYLSAGLLVASGVVAARIAGRLRRDPFARFWAVAAAGFVFLGMDDLLVIHERVDAWLHRLLGWDPEHWLTDHLDDAIVGGYGVAAGWWAYRHRRDLGRLRWMLAVLAVAFACFAAMVVLDATKLSKVAEDSFKILAGALILVALLAAARDPRLRATGAAGPSSRAGAGRPGPA